MFFIYILSFFKKKVFKKVFKKVYNKLLGVPKFMFGGMIRKKISSDYYYYYMAMGINQVSNTLSAPIVGSFQIKNADMSTITGNFSYKGYFFGKLKNFFV